MKIALKITLFFFASQLKAQVEIFSPAIVCEENSAAFICYNNSNALSGTSINDRYLVYYTTDTLFLDVSLNGIWTRKIAHVGNNISLATSAIQQDTIWLCWKESPFIKTRFSTNHGDTWSSVMNVSPLGGNVSGPSISAASNGKIHVVWFNESTTDTTVLHNVYSNGAFLPNPTVLSSVGFKASWPSVTASGDSVFCTWKETHAQTIIYFSKSFEGGNPGTWSAPASTNGPNTAKDPNVSYAFDANSNTHYLYLVCDGNQKIYLQRSTDFGSNWSAPVVVSNASKKSQFAKVESNSSGFVGVSWEHRTGVSLFDDTKKDVGFCYSTSFASAGSFSHDSLAYTNNPLGSTLSQINKIDETNFYLLWKTNDTVNGKTIFYERRISTNSTTNALKNEVLNVFSVSPNPCSDYFTIHSNQNSFFEINLFDLTGSLILHEKNCQENQQIDIRNLKKGVYFLTISNQEKRYKLLIY